MGTPPYTCPELLKAPPLIPASDIYSAGIMSYELLIVIGARLFRKESLHEGTWTNVKTAPIRSCKLLQSNQRARSSVRIERWSPEPKVRGSNPLGRMPEAAAKWPFSFGFRLSSH